MVRVLFTGDKPTATSVANASPSLLVSSSEMGTLFSSNACTTKSASSGLTLL